MGQEVKVVQEDVGDQQMSEYANPITQDKCYLCGKPAVFSCDNLPPCDHEMCEEHYVMEHPEDPPYGADNREPDTLCLQHASNQRKRGE